MNHNENRTTPGLAYWRYAGERMGDVLNRDALATLLAQPRCTEAFLLMMRNSVDHHFKSPILARAARDMRRFFAGFFVLHLDAQGEVTLATVKALCREMGLASPGRAAALLIQLRLIGYIVPAPVQADRRARRYIPSPQMRACFDTFFRDTLTAAALVEPDAMRVADQLDDPRVYRAFLSKLAMGTATIARLRTRNPLTAFANPTAGIGIIYEIALSGEAGDAFPPRGCVRMSVAALARKFNVSRAHVLRMLRRAESEGSLRRDGDESTGVLCDPLRQTLLEFLAVTLMGTLGCAHAALEAIEGMDAKAA